MKLGTGNSELLFYLSQPLQLDFPLTDNQSDNEGPGNNHSPCIGKYLAKSLSLLGKLLFEKFATPLKQP